MAKRQKVAKPKHLEDQEAEWEEIPVPKAFKRSVEDLDKKRRLQEAAENFVKSGATQKELLAALAEAKIAQNTKNKAEIVTSNVLLQTSSTCGLEEWQRANLERTIQDPRDGKNDGGLTPPISRLLSECIPLSDVAAVVAATEQSKASLASVLSVSTRPAPHPMFRNSSGMWEYHDANV